jgi:hypothetical protein
MGKGIARRAGLVRSGFDLSALSEVGAMAGSSAANSDWALVLGAVGTALICSAGPVTADDRTMLSRMPRVCG